MTYKVVIGSAFGDEGKGSTTDYISSPNTLIVLYQGGSQRGHTVVTPEGLRHVFHHFGSGTLKGARTLLAREFICNPYIFNDEYELLTSYGLTPKIKYHSSCVVTTPYDMMINQIAEEYRGDKRHGSCGLGINETIRRNEVSKFTLTMADITDTEFRNKLKNIQQNWIYERLNKLNILASDEWKKRIENDAIIDDYIQKAEQMITRAQDTNDIIEIMMEAGDIVFEGAQGLLLDQYNYEMFPYLTPSCTGLDNIFDLFGLSTPIEAIYVTRAYATRHGPGPFLHEDKNLSFEDQTNVPNMWQKSLRFGYLDLDFLSKTIHKDKDRFQNVKGSIAVTCLDQVGETITYFYEGNKKVANRKQFLRDIKKATNLPIKYISFGPTRNDIIKLE